MSSRLDGLERLAELRVPSRLAREWAAAGVVVALFETSGRRGRRMIDGPAARCLKEGGPWPSCLPAPPVAAVGGVRMRCARVAGLHLISSVQAQGQVVAYLVTSAVRTSGKSAFPAAQTDLLARCLEIMADEMQQVLSLDPSGWGAPPDFPELVGEMPPFHEVRSELRRALAVRYPVLVLGESGTGKDLIAWLLHHRGPRPDGPYVSVNCAALPEQLLESELFGHRRGAFTSADRDKPGMFALARGGTLLLDEIQQMSLGAQAKLLRVVESGEFMALGGLKTESSDARLIAATNADLEELVAAKRFRKDLFYRLSVLSIRTPSLRQVQGDIPRLVAHFVDQICKREGLDPRSVSSEALGALLVAPWPGNVRQLIHELERALLRCSGGELRPEHLSPALRGQAPARARLTQMRDALARAWEREEIRLGLERTGWNVSRLARELGVSRRGLTDKIVRYGLRRAK